MVTNINFEPLMLNFQIIKIKLFLPSLKKLSIYFYLYSFLYADVKFTWRHFTEKIYVFTIT